MKAMALDFATQPADSFRAVRPVSPPVHWRAAFGPFLLSTGERRLLRNGVPVKLGGRALDLLIALVGNAGAVVGKKELLARVWEGVCVDEGSLRFHMHVVRKVLGDGEGGQRYIVNTANKGYTFVAPVERHDIEAGPTTPVAVSPSLPAFGATVVGRDEDVRNLLHGVLHRRFLCIVGAGGIGKTTVAIAAAQSAAAGFHGDVIFVDFSLISTVEMVRSTVAAAIGLQDAIASLATITTHLADRRALLVLDCCEHVIASAAELSEALMRACPHVHILATSREPLRAEGEQVYRLPPLAFPPEGEGTTAAAALAYPAVRLFVDRVAASDAGFEFKDADAPLASQLCRELDGIALAIELAAGRIEALGLRAVTSHFDASVRLMWHGRRTAVPRHQTLTATLDWSYRLLRDEEQRLARRLSVFAGSFLLDAALDICCFDMEQSGAVELLAGLVSKSLLNVDAGGTQLRYAMLDTTKSYCWKKLTESQEDARLSAQFSGFYADWARRQAAMPVNREARGVISDELPNVSAALEWTLRQDEKRMDAAEMAASFCPLLLQLSRLADCAHWAQSALAGLPPALHGSPVEVGLQGALGQSLMFTGGDGDQAVHAFERSISLAQAQGNAKDTLHLLNGYAVLLHRDGRYADALSTARKARALLPQLDDPESRAIVDSLMGVTLHLVGQVDEAMRYFEQSASYGVSSRTDTTSRLGFDHHIRALCGVARTLWLTGRYAEAIKVAEDAIDKARDHGHAVTYCIALLWAGSVFTYGSDVERLEWMVATLEGVAKQHALTPYLNVANITRGQMLITRGRVAEGVERIRSAVEALHACRYEMVTSVSLTFMARGLSDLSLHAAALSMCEHVRAMIERCGDHLRMPELLTTRGRVMLAAGDSKGAEGSWRAAIGLARQQGVKSGQVKAAVALAQHMLRSGRNEEADQILRPQVISAGDEMSPDLLVARSMLR